MTTSTGTERAWATADDPCVGTTAPVEVGFADVDRELLWRAEAPRASTRSSANDEFDDLTPPCRTSATSRRLNETIPPE
ncbi:MAG TPA: hypothetical protein VK116_13355, partial [Planctomycetota bacterium]|nr:hypothetical protein [Planctomycetota bacterium]